MNHFDYRKKAPTRMVEQPGALAPSAYATLEEAGREPLPFSAHAPFNLLMIRDYMIEMVAALWSEPGHYLFPEKPSRIAFTLKKGESAKQQDPAKSIYVTSAQAWNPDNPDFLPAIYVALGDGTFQGVSGGAKQTAVNFNDRDSETDYQTLARSTVRFIHEGQDETETVALLSNTLDMLTAFAAKIRQDFCFTEFDVVGWGWPKPLGSDSKPGRFKGQITCAYAYSHTWTLQQAAPRLKRLQLAAGLSPTLSVQV